MNIANIADKFNKNLKDYNEIEKYGNTIAEYKRIEEDHKKLCQFVNDISEELAGFRELKNHEIMNEVKIHKKKANQMDELMEAYNEGKDITEYINRKVAESSNE